MCAHLFIATALYFIRTSANSACRFNASTALVVKIEIIQQKASSLWARCQKGTIFYTLLETFPLICYFKEMPLTVAERERTGLSLGTTVHLNSSWHSYTLTYGDLQWEIRSRVSWLLRDTCSGHICRWTLIVARLNLEPWGYRALSVHKLVWD